MWSVPRAPCVPLVVLFFLVTLCQFRTPGAMRRGVTSNVSFLSRTSLFECAGIPFCTTFKSKLTFLFPPCSVVISTRSLIGPWIGVAPIRRTRLEKVLLPFVASSMRVLWWIFSGTCTRLLRGSRGPDGMALSPRASTLSLFLPSGSRPSQPALWCPVLSRITVGSRSLSRCPTSFPLLQACGNSILPS